MNDDRTNHSKRVGDYVLPDELPDTIIDPERYNLVQMNMVVPKDFTLESIAALLHRISSDMASLPHDNSQVVLTRGEPVAMAVWINRRENPSERENVVMAPFFLDARDPLEHEAEWIALSATEQASLNHWEHQQEDLPTLHDTELEKLLNDES